METIRLSYIVPVFNTLAWLGDCLDSLLDHKGNDVEFVVVDDGSTDGSSEMLARYAAKDRRIRLISQENKGLSVARNVGLANAAGEYILFADSDDMVAPTAVSHMLETAVKENADIVTGQILCLDSNGVKTPWGNAPASGVYHSGPDYMQAANSATYIPMVFGYMFRRDLPRRHSLEFVPGLIHEDELWTPMLLARAWRVAATDVSHYYYRTDREGSIMNHRDPFSRCLSIAIIIRRLSGDIMTLARNPEYVKALPFYYRRLATLVSIMNSIPSSSADGVMSLIKASANEYFMDFCVFLKHHRRSTI